VQYLYKDTVDAYFMDMDNYEQFSFSLEFLGDMVGYQVTLRGKRAEDFLNRLIHVALPRTKDFKGISKEALDDIGNLTIGIKEHTVFPETVDEELKDVFGLAVTIVTSAKDKKSAELFLTYLGLPFKKA
jgi:large subunit ribosomal protein L5